MFRRLGECAVVADIATELGEWNENLAGICDHIAVDRIAQHLGPTVPRSRTSETPVRGGAIRDVAAMGREARSRAPVTIADQALEAILRAHGSNYEDVLRVAAEEPAWAEPVGGADVIGAEVVHAARLEMARSLADFWFRRTELGSGAFPGEDALRRVAGLMGSVLEWPGDRREREIAAVRAALPGTAEREGATAWS